MRHGLPVIASVHDAGQEVNRDQETGYNVDLNDPQALSDRLTELLRDSDTARRMGGAGQARWQQHFRFGAFKSRLLDTLDRIHDL
jgi:phosphatidylinositol alpha-1,6-mannosyltransferase